MIFLKLGKALVRFSIFTARVEIGTARKSYVSTRSHIKKFSYLSGHFNPVRVAPKEITTSSSPLLFWMVYLMTSSPDSVLPKTSCDTTILLLYKARRPQNHPWPSKWWCAPAIQEGYLSLLHIFIYTHSMLTSNLQLPLFENILFWEFVFLRWLC